jgi:hypothetical protein
MRSEGKKGLSLEKDIIWLEILGCGRFDERDDDVQPSWLQESRPPSEGGQSESIRLEATCCRSCIPCPLSDSFPLSLSALLAVIGVDQVAGVITSPAADVRVVQT